MCKAGSKEVQEGRKEHVDKFFTTLGLLVPALIARGWRAGDTGVLELLSGQLEVLWAHLLEPLGPR